MKYHRPLKRSLLATLLALLAVASLQAETLIRYQARPGSKLRLEGTSTVHDWKVEGGIIGGFMEIESNFPLDPSKASPSSGKVNAKVEVNIPVRSLKSGKPLMDEIMHGAMKENQYPKIEYRLKELTLKPRVQGAPLKFDALGELAVAGMARTNKMEVTMEPIENSRLRVVGQTAIKMTDFGIQPPAPSIGLGLIKTGDDVKIFFEWLTVQRADSAKTGSKPAN
jgi:polyisoprenoid-binding protein YceI